MSVGNELQVLKLNSEVFGSPKLRAEISVISNTTNISNMNSSHHEDENLLRTRRDIMIPIINSPKSESRFLIETRPSPATTHKLLQFRKRLREVMSSKLVEIGVVVLIIIYMLIVLLNIVLDDGAFDSVSNVDTALGKLKYVELSILCVFTLEILLKVWGFGFKGYFKDCWYVLDAIIILATFVLVVVDIEWNENRVSGFGKIRGLFRLFRIFMLMRKANQFSRITKSRNRTSGVDFKSPVEKILDLLESLKLSVNDKNVVQEIDWAIEVISENKLYEPLIESSDEKPIEKADASLWLKAYGKEHQKTLNRKEPRLNIFDMAQKMSLLNPNGGKKDACNLLAAPISQEAIEMLDKESDNLTFDVFGFKTAAKEDDLLYMACYLFQKKNLFQYLNISQFTFTKFMKRIQSGYLDNTYHNSTHATDVLQTVNYFLTTGEFIAKANPSNLEIAAMYIAAAVHDFEHPGTNNTFQVHTGSSFAIRYNDKGVLENHHVAATFTLLKEDSLNIFNNFSKADFKNIREKIIGMVLATDMANHFTDVGKLKGRLAADYDMKIKDKNFTMELLIHAADISNPAKQWAMSYQWTTRVMQEFFDQGDQERNLDLSITHLCDKYTVNTGKSQVGFIDFVVAPFFGLLKEILPKIDISNLDVNKNNWKELIDYYEQELTKLNEKRDNKKILS